MQRIELEECSSQFSILASFRSHVGLGSSCFLSESQLVCRDNSQHQFQLSAETFPWRKRVSVRSCESIEDHKFSTLLVDQVDLVSSNMMFRIKRDERGHISKYVPE